MGNIRRARSEHLNNKEEDDWKSLAFGRRGTYNPASREKDAGAFAFQRIIPFFPRPCQEARPVKQDLDEVVQMDVVAAKR
jgi:hypothetical protein